MSDALSLAPTAATRLAPLALELVGRSPVAIRLQELVRRAAALEAPLLVVAERGADVDGLVRELHARRAPHAPLVPVGCAAQGVEKLLFGASGRDLPPDLEAISADCRLAHARGGTLFLQEVTELPAAVQGRLARILRDGELRINGAPVQAGVRFVATASPAIDADVHEHRFRPDLYRRLAASRIDLPPLGQRQDDVPAMAERVLEEVCAAQGAPARSFTQAALALVGAVSWRGNLLELRDVVERAALASQDNPLQIEHVLPAMQLDRPRVAFAPSGNLRDARLRFERDYIAAVLQHHGWRMSDAARTLGIQRPNLYRKARQLGIPLVKVTE